MVQKSRFVRALLSARAIAPNYLELHVRSKICVSEREFFVPEACQPSQLG